MMNKAMILLSDYQLLLSIAIFLLCYILSFLMVRRESNRFGKKGVAKCVQTPYKYADAIQSGLCRKCGRV